MNRIRGLASEFSNFGFSAKFVGISGLNYLVGNLIFMLFWFFNIWSLPYLVIASISTFLSVFFSYQTQTRILIKSRDAKKFRSFGYLSIQIGSLMLASLVVPFLSRSTSLSYIAIQFVWSAAVSVLSVLFLFGSSSSNRTND